MKNPLLVDFTTPFNTIPFDKISENHYLPAIETSIEATLEEIESICQNEDLPTFENTIETLEKSGERLGVISATLFNLNSAETSDEIQKLTQQAAPLLTQLQNDIRLNQVLFDRIKSVYELENASLTPEQHTLLDKEYKSFVRNGALLNNEEKKQ